MSQRRMKTMDGNNAAAYVSYPFTEVAAIFPITPSSEMAELTDAWSVRERYILVREAARVPTYAQALIDLLRAHHQTAPAAARARPTPRRRR